VSSFYFFLLKASPFTAGRRSALYFFVLEAFETLLWRKPNSHCPGSAAEGGADELGRVITPFTAVVR